MGKVSARLHVLLAPDAPVGVVIRRGPAKQVCTIGWDRKDDTFRVGQWLKGRIYERRSDLSPDGRHLIYFAMNGKWRSETRGSWTALSKAPFLKAVGLWAKGDCWNGGGLFVDRHSYWLNGGCGHTTISEPPRLRPVAKCPYQGNFGGECPGVYYLRLQRDGWVLLDPKGSAQRSEVVVFEKPLPGGWVLRKFAHATLNHPVGTGCYFDDHQLVNKKTGRVIECPSWEWAEFDGQRLVYAEAGCLLACAISADGLSQAKVLQDFNGMKFEARVAPY